MKFVFRVDNGAHIGQGHLSRCENLAQHFVDNGHSVLFCYREHFQGRKPRFESIKIGNGILAPANLKNYDEWLGCTQEEDAKDFLKDLPKEEMYLIIDHYSLDKTFEGPCKNLFKKITTIDDLAHREHECDFLVNYNFGFSEKDYKNKISSNTKLLLGLDYFILKKEMKSARAGSKKLNEKINSILVNLGTTSSGILETLMQGFKNSKLDKKVLIITSESNKNKLSLAANIEIMGPAADIEKYYAQADFAIGAAGVSMWERAFMGLPSSIFMTAENQNHNIEEARKLKLADIQKNFTLTSEEAWKSYFLALDRIDLRTRESYRQKGMDLIDGEGLNRVLRNILEDQK